MDSLTRELVNDIKDLNLKKVNIGSLRHKYQSDAKIKCRIVEVVDFIISNNLKKFFLDNEFHGDFRDKQLAFLLECEKGYEVFDSERCGKHFLKKYDDYESALFDYLDRLFNEIGIIASDSIINS